jgi:hypothetical protein
MKIGGIFSDLLPREMQKRGIFFEDKCPRWGYFEKLGTSSVPPPRLKKFGEKKKFIIAPRGKFGAPVIQGIKLVWPRCQFSAF